MFLGQSKRLWMWRHTDGYGGRVNISRRDPVGFVANARNSHRLRLPEESAAQECSTKSRECVISGTAVCPEVNGVRARWLVSVVLGIAALCCPKG